ncbi:hypothetical protein FRB93_000350 [Tulasnella sp. JGI-2019a]|nr:hypothetical protein FRB93_000350 [Tulasnella sp. JGI-2019a]
MAWRAVSARTTTGTNDVPLGKMRRFGPTVVEEAAKPHIIPASPSAFPRHQNEEVERGRQDAYVPPPDSASAADPNAAPKRKSRWGAAATEVAGLPTAVSSAGVSVADLDKYATQVRLEEINRKLRINDFIPPDHERSPSPPPTYDAHGRRTNTREVRYRKRLEEERLKLIDKALKSDPNYRPPAEYHQQKRSHRPQEKVYIPVKEFPEINFFGLLVGPRGNSLKKMERESGAKISIRGKGSVKEGKGRPDAFADDAEEDLHCLIMAETEEKVTACVNLINRVIETAASTPEGENDHKRNQLRELAALNGTLRDDENQVCQNCGNVGHRKYDCPEQRNYTANIICRVCGSAGHMARDCTQRRGDPNGFQAPGFPAGAPPPPGNGGPPTKFDSEYDNLMAELGEKPTGGAAGGNAAPGGGGVPFSAASGLNPPADGAAGGYIPPGFTTVPPWRRPDVWQAPSAPQGGPGGFRPHQGGFGGPGGIPGQGYGGGGGYQGQGYGGGQQNYQQQQPGGYGQGYQHTQGGQPGYDAGAYAQYYQGLYQQQQQQPGYTAAPPA